MRREIKAPIMETFLRVNFILRNQENSFEEKKKVKMVDLKSGDTVTIITELVISALGLYLALVFSRAIQNTIQSWFPQEENSIRGDL